MRRKFSRYCTSCIRLLLLFALVAGAFNARAGVSSGQADGYLDRGIFMHDASINLMALDQLTQYASMAGGDEKTALLVAVSQASLNDPAALQSLLSFQGSYPLSGARDMVWLVAGNVYMDRGEWSKALECYESIPDRSLALRPAQCRLYNMGVAYLQLGSLREANNLMSMLDNSPYSVESRFYRGYIAYRDEEYPVARTLLEGVDADEMPAAAAPYYLCQIYYLLGDNDKALGLARRLLQGNMPRAYQAEVARIAGESLYNLKDVDLAIPYLRQYVKDVEGQPLPSALYILGMSQYGAGDYREAIESLKTPSTLNDAMGQSALLTTGQCYMHLGEMSPAIIALNRAVELDADLKVTEEAYYNYCVARSDGGKVPFGSSVSVFEGFLKRFPSSRYASTVSEYLAYGYMNDDNYEEALASINRIANPGEKVLEARQQILYTLGARDLSAGKYDSALKYLTEARKAAGNDRSRVNECDLLMADCYYKKGDYSRAEKLYNDYLTKGSAADVNRALATYDLGYAYFAQKKYNPAATRFEQFLKMNGISTNMKADATNRIADCLYASRDLDGAMKQYEKAAQIEPSTADYPMYQRATIMGWSGNPQGHIDGLNSMIARFPGSPLVPQALLDIAEAQTTSGQRDAALITYRRIECDYPATAQCRQALLLMGSLLSEQNKSGEAYEVYRRLIAKHSPSREANIGARYMQEVAADAGKLDDYVAFMKSVPNAPKVDPSEIDRITFTRATDAEGWRAYLERYPQGEYAPQAMLLIAQSSLSAKRYQNALEQASQLLERYPDGEFVAGALSVKGDAEVAMEMIPEALESYRLLEARASDSGTLNHARLGQLKAARDLAMYDDVVAIADRLTGSSTLGTGQLTEVNFIKATALNNLDRGEEAVVIWTSLAENINDLNGVKSLYYLGQYYLDNDNMKRAREYADKLIDSNTPHSYWLARGYILMSDIYRAKGDNFEADEYLKSLRENYPGNEPDILNMIDSRLNP
ncbi:MAG: tetratricopeptide repeat protein [Bacteroidales bacterium]|nr:tetratricopeptide repeat protein [Bacteroidales bacterium]